ncbi:efflux RND transporter periplasmic adaptor subunit [Clostridium sp. AM58-1XD]|uniref:efflux RND transporter periplasmic adaptor subunit n=1 Tax=Clostridium sp. AM58-1XD TaxID=2292307 RepID=UPI000E4F1CBC|nr:efflux RND transporter periplasmic adaptor subunit [Clostridium sp. AM58-1XD]RGY99474.1 efflux RND transporter periplasmic adaptor subunit [Clostridium sp. AM58-1XD]
MNEERLEKTESEKIDEKIQEIMESDNEEDGGKKKRKKKRSGTPFREKWKGFSRRRKVVTILIILACALFLLSKCGGQSKKDTGPVVTVMDLARQPIQEKLTVNGPVSGTDSVDVVSNIHAEITAMNVKEGDTVKKGDILAVVDNTDLKREVEIAQNAYDLAVVNKREKDKSEALGYEKAVQDFQKAQADYNRSSMLFASGGITQVEMEQAANALKDAKRLMEGYTVVNGRGAADPSYELQIENAAYELEKKKEELENAEIKSTIDGTVVRVNSKVGQFADKVEDDKPIFSIENLDQLEMEIKVSEYSIGKVQVGQKAVISADILNGKTVEGEVIKISPTGEEKGGGSTERVIPITIRIDGKDIKLIAGITAKAEILIRESQDAFVVPVTALIDDGTTASIGVVENGNARLIPVTLGVDGDVNVEVIPAEGAELTEGMQVITNAGPQITDGMAVTILPQK